MIYTNGIFSLGILNLTDYSQTSPKITRVIIYVDALHKVMKFYTSYSTFRMRGRLFSSFITWRLGITINSQLYGKQLKEGCCEFYIYKRCIWFFFLTRKRFYSPIIISQWNSTKEQPTYIFLLISITLPHEPSSCKGPSWSDQYESF